MIRLNLFGSVDLKGSDGSDLRGILAQPKPLALLAYLASATPVGFHRREELLSIFWPELDSTRGRRALSQALHVLRGELDDGAIASRGVEDVGIDRNLITCDVDDFRNAIAAREWSEASRIYRGDLLSGFLIAGSPEFDQWLDKERSRLRDQAIDAAWHLSSDAEQASDSKAAHRWARRAMELDPYSEQGVRRLLTLLDRSGNRTEAIRAYEEFRARITRELDLEPSEETRSLATKLRQTVSVPMPVKAPRDDLPAPSSIVVPHPDDVAVSARPRRLRLAVGLPLVLAGVAAAFFVAKGRPPSGDSTPAPASSRIVIAEFESAAGDTALGRTVTEALRLDLSRSHLIKVVSDATARDALVLMQRDTMLRMKPDLAREVAIRESAKAVLAGDVRRTGNGFALSARLVSAITGDLIGGWRANAKDSSELLKAIDGLSVSVRRDAGESMRAIAATSPLLRVSTRSLGALRKHAMGTDAFFAEDYRRAVRLFEEAVAEDTTFADAYMMLASILQGSGSHQSRGVEYAVKAYQYRDRLRDAERYNALLMYLWLVKGDIPGAIDAQYNAAELDPGIVFWGRLTSMLTQQRRYRDAELAALRGLQWETNPFLYYHLGNSRYRAGKVDEARRTLAYALRIYPRSAALIGQRIDMLEALGDYRRADSLAHALPSSGGGFPQTQQAYLDALLGRIDEARAHFAEVRRGYESVGYVDAAVRTSIQLARLELERVGDTALALSKADSIVASSSWKELYARERLYVPLAHFYVTAGKFDRARALLSDYKRDVPADFRARDRSLLKRTSAMLRVSQGDRSAIDDIKTAVLTENQPVSALADVVWAYRRVGTRDEVARAARAYLDEINARRLEDDAFNLATMTRLAGTTRVSAGSR
jgi:DNA-binding SARP family transcriptional activator/TolB-like protein